MGEGVCELKGQLPREGHSRNYFTMAGMFSEFYDRLQEPLRNLLREGTPWDCPDFPISPETEAALKALRWDVQSDTARAEVFLFRAAEDREERHQGRIYPVVPVYATSICTESCLYCNYRRGNREGVERVRLGTKELEEEIHYLIRTKGYRVIELVYATDPGVTAEDIAEHVRLAGHMLSGAGGGITALNGPSLSEEEYRLLAGEDIGFVALWQETYDEERYRELHPPPGRKHDFRNRLDAFDRMLRAGISRIGMGVLSGLADWRYDWAMLLLHEEYLQRTYGRGPAVLGIPRLKPAPGATEITGYTPTDLEFRYAVAIHQKYRPDCYPFVNTREDWSLCMDLASGGGCLFTFNCSTIPGGYTRRHRGSQFFSHDFEGPLFREAAARSGLKVGLPWSGGNGGGEEHKSPTPRDSALHGSHGS